MRVTRSYPRPDVERPTDCPVYAGGCVTHGFVHGAEAEELRAGIERLIADHRYDEDQDDFRVGEGVNALCDDLQGLLDAVDARDSLAFREIPVRKPVVGYPRKRRKASP